MRFYRRGIEGDRFTGKEGGAGVLDYGADPLKALGNGILDLIRPNLIVEHINDVAYGSGTLKALASRLQLDPVPDIHVHFLQEFQGKGRLMSTNEQYGT